MTVLALGCSKKDDAPVAGTAFISGQEYLIVSGRNENTQGEALRGTLKAIFRKMLDNGLRAKTGFKIEFSLQDGGSFDLIVNSKADLTEGAIVRFTRNGNVLLGGASHAVRALEGVNASGNLSLTIDVHNDEGHFAIRSGTRMLLNVEPNQPHSVPQGSGDKWGVELNNATLTSITKGASDLED